MRFVFMVYSIAGWVALALLVAYWMIAKRVRIVPPSPPPPPEGIEEVTKKV
jgi:hypothetical protein